MKGILAGLIMFLPWPSSAQTPADSSELQLEPLVITAPRLRIQQLAIDPQINQQLLRLLQTRQNARPDSTASMDASVGNLAKISTVTGYKLKARYTQLGFLLTEGLAGVTDLQLASELQKTAAQGKNPQIRASAMVALAYTRDLSYASIFQSGLLDPNITVRFGALESLLTMNDPSIQFQVGNVARMDASLIAQVYAASGMWRLGDIYGREILLRLAENSDWLVRSMAIRYLGELGKGEEYRKILQWFGFESNQMVKAEMCSALLNLQKYAEQ